MQITGPYTPAAGTPIQVNDPAQFTSANVAIQIQNESDFPLIAVIGGGLNSVAPFTAETISTGQANLLTITPQAGGTIGEITLVWMLEGEASPVPDGPLTGTTTVVRGGGSVAFYPSLTGPGESATPGELDQKGDFTVTTATSFISLHDTGPTLGPPGNIAVALVTDNNGVIVSAAQFIAITGNGADPGGCIINIGGSADKLKFFSTTPGVGPQVSGGTLAGVIAGLVALGLFSS